MKTSNELISDPIPPSSDEPLTLGIAALIEGLAAMLIEAGFVVRKLEAQTAQDRRQQLQAQLRIEDAQMRQQECLLQINQRVASIAQDLGNLSRETAKCAEHGGRTGQRVEVLEFNLEQVRLLADAMVQKQQQLVEDFIERRVTDHLYKQFLDIQSALARYAANSNPNLQADIQAAAEAIESFLAESGLRILNPTPGDAFEPREHQPIKVLPIGNAAADGTIAETFTPGLSRSHRVIQQARVAVFKTEGAKPAR
jgi:molecular chaperone GrpE (heat shock protein)